MDSMHFEVSARQSSIASAPLSPQVSCTGERLLSVTGLEAAYGDRRVLKGLDFSLHAGEMVAIIGRSGAGKSTLLHVMNGSVPASGGEIRYHSEGGGERDILGANARQWRDWRSECGMIFQDFCLVPRLDVMTNVLLGRLHHTSSLKSFFKIFSTSDRARAVALLEWLGMLPKALQRAENLSGGQMQRVAICRALMQQPRLLLADEPVASLDPRNTQRIMEALRQISHEGIGVMVNLHSIELVKQYCTRAIGLSQGEILFDGKPDHIDEPLLQQLYGDERDGDDRDTLH